MATALEPIVFRGMHRGMADSDAVADSMMPSTQWRLLLNMDTRIIGFPVRRNGYERLGSAEVVSGKTILGLHEHIGTNNQIVAFCNDSGDSNAEAYYLSGSTWTNKTLGFTAGTKIRTITFLDYIIAVNGTDSPKSWNGDTGASWGSTNLTSAPTGSLIAAFKQRVYIGDPSDDTISWSSVPSSGSITWTAADNFQLNPNDGSSLTAFVVYAKMLLFFKDKFIYRFDGDSTDPDPVIDYGTPSQESVTVDRGRVWFYDANKDGAFVYAGGFPEKISNAVDKFFQAVPTSNKTNVTVWSNGREVEFVVGDITVDGETFDNAALRYHIDYQSWCVRSYANEFRVYSAYDDGTDNQRLLGTTDGHVVKMDKGNKDLSTSISYILETPKITIGNNPALKLNIAGVGVFVDNSILLSAQIKTNKDDTWRMIGSCKEFVNVFDYVNKDANRAAFRFTGISDAEPLRFDGFSVIRSVTKGLEKDTQST